MDARSKDGRDWENLCRRCGRCCHYKVRSGDVVILTDIPCEFLDPVSKLCVVYSERRERQPLCLSAAESVEQGVLPAGCPYVEGLGDYVSPLLVEEHPEFLSVVDRVFPERSGERMECSVKSAMRFRRRKRRER